MKNAFSRFGALTIAGLVLAFGLAACGGGGGGGESPAPTPAPVPVVDTTKPQLTLATSSPASTTTTVVFTSNEDLGGNVSVSVKNASGTAVAGGTTLNAGNRGMTWTPGTALACNAVYTAVGTGTDLAGNTGTATGTVTTVACPPLKYTDKVYAIFTNSYIYLMENGQKIPADNQTSYQTGVNKLFNCAMTRSDQKLADGHVLDQCTASSDLARHTVKLNPAMNVLTDFTGPVPSGTTFTSAEADSTQPVAGTTSCRVSNGWYYADPTNRSRLLFQADAGGAPAVKYNGTFAADGTIAVLRCLSN